MRDTGIKGMIAVTALENVTTNANIVVIMQITRYFRVLKR